MGHPMQLHDHKSWVLSSGIGSFPYSSVTDAPPSLIDLKNPLYHDKTDLPPSEWVAIRYSTMLYSAPLEGVFSIVFDRYIT